MLAIPQETPIPAMDSGHASSLEEALKTERRLLEDLIGVLERQRNGVATDDIALVDDAVFAAQRVLRTLAEARRRRRALLSILAGQENLPLRDLDEALGTTMSLSLRTARDELVDAARRVSHALDKNRRILQGALSAGDTLLRTLTGAPQGPVVYTAPGSPADDAGGPKLVDRQV